MGKIALLIFVVALIVSAVAAFKHNGTPIWLRSASLDDRFLGLNHIMWRRRACRTRYG